MTPVYWWFIVGLILTALEIVHPAFVIFWFGISGILTGLIALLIPHALAVQWVIFAVLSAVLVVFSRRIAHRWLRKSPDGVGSGRLDGAIGIVTKKINPPETGMVKVLGDLMRAVADRPIETGVRVRVKQVVGTHLEVEPIEKEVPSQTEAGGK